MERAAATGPPRLPFAFSVGVTGHRSGFPGLDADAVRARAAPVLDALAEAALTLRAEHPDAFAPGPACLRLISPLADGADQWVAQVALDGGWRLSAVLPFAREDYRQDFIDAGTRAEFDAFLDRADTLFELPGDRAAEGEAYAMAGAATVAHADAVIAMWDGATARGPGGTAEVVELAWARGLPVIHVPVVVDAPVRLLWSGFDAHCARRLDPRCARDWSGDAMRPVLRALLAPPDEGAEARYLRLFLRERQHLLRRRLEFPLLVSLSGAGRLPADTFRSRPYHEVGDAEWQPYRQSCADAHDLRVGLDQLQDLYCWADGLARHFAQSYRSGHVFNFALGALAVLLALTSLLWKDGKFLLAFGELVAVLAIIANTRMGTAAAWHRRWLDYRQLAERLRPMRSLATVGLARPPAADGPQRWTDWVAAAAWRALELPSGRIAPDGQGALARTLAEAELVPQVDYNRRSAKVSQTLDHRLHRLGTLLFALTLVGTVALILALFIAPTWASRHGAGFVWLSAGLPALGTAIWGIRVQGDFGGTAQRSLATAGRLEPVIADLRAGVRLPRAAALFEAASRLMVADLDEWRREHQKHELALP